MGYQGNIFKGIIISLMVPFVGFAVVLMITDWFLADRTARDIFNERTLYLIAICFNIITINFFKRRNENKTLRGALLTTMALAVGWIIYFGASLL